MRVTDGEKGSRDCDRIVHGRTLSDAPVVDVASEIPGRDGVNDVCLFGGDTDHAKMRSNRYADVLQDPVVLFNGAMVNRDTRVVDGVVDHSEGIGLRGPAEIVDRLCPVPLSGGIDLEDGDDLARLGLGDQLFVMEAPPRRSVTPEGFARVGRVCRWARLHVHDPDFKDVARLRISDVDGTGADVHAEALARTTLQLISFDRAGTATVHTLLILGPEIDALRPGIALDHPLRVVIGVVGQSLDGHVVSGLDLDGGLEQLAEVTPVDRLSSRRQIVMIGSSLTRGDALSGCCTRHQCAAGGKGSGTTCRREGTLEEAPSFGIKVVQQLPPMEVKLRTVVIVASTHRNIPPEKIASKPPVERVSRPRECFTLHTTCQAVPISIPI